MTSAAFSPDTQLTAHALTFDAPVNACAFNKNNTHAAFGLGDGCIKIIDAITPSNERISVDAHSGAVPKLFAYGDDAFVSLSDDGTLNTLGPDGSLDTIASFNGAWTEKMAVHDNGAVAVAVEREVHLWMTPGSDVQILGPHDSTVNDIAFAPDGLGLAVAHRDGVTLWAWPHYTPQSNHLPWKGAHLAITISPDKKWIVSAMQEGALHMWNLALKRDYQMRGYWAKPTAMTWTHDHKWLATSGAEAVILWPFDKAGPDGREAVQLGWSNGALVTCVTAHPHAPVVIAGFEDGAVSLLDVKENKTYGISAASGHAITTLSFSDDGDRLLAGSQNGGALLIHL